MLRSLISLLLLASFGSSPFVWQKMSFEFDPVSLLVAERIPFKKGNGIAPVLKAKAALAMDAGTGIVLFEKNAEDPLPMASLTKIMTAILILEAHGLKEVVKVTQNYSSLPGVKIGLQKNERINVGDLLTGLLVRSGGDAALTLAEYHSGSVAAFVEEMNRKATALHLKNTVFKNPIGLDEEGHVSSAYDLGVLAQYAMRKRDFRSIVRLTEAELTSVDGDIRHVFQNTNKLLGSYLNVLGVKTGTTDAAGDSIINVARGNEGQEVIAVVLSSPDRFQENKILLDWSLRNYFW